MSAAGSSRCRPSSAASPLTPAAWGGSGTKDQVQGPGRGWPCRRHSNTSVLASSCSGIPWIPSSAWRGQTWIVITISLRVPATPLSSRESGPDLVLRLLLRGRGAMGHWVFAAGACDMLQDGALGAWNHSLAPGVCRWGGTALPPKSSLRSTRLLRSTPAARAPDEPHSRMAAARPGAPSVDGQAVARAGDPGEESTWLAVSIMRVRCVSGLEESAQPWHSGGVRRLPPASISSPSTYRE